MAASHSSVVIGHSDEVIATGTSVGVDEELGHVQITGGTHRNTSGIQTALLLHSDFLHLTYVFLIDIFSPFIYNTACPSKTVYRD